MRKFYLVNKYGQRWDLNDPISGLLTQPSGLGFDMEYSYSRIGYGFKRNYFRDKQSKLSGTMIFGGDSPYEAYRRFVTFINASDGIKLAYKIPSGEYYRDVDVVGIGKTEITENQVLECTVTFACRGLFYSSQTDRFIVSRTQGELRWDFTWPARFNDYDSRSLFVSNDGHVPAAVQAEINGYCENPSIAVMQSGIELYKIIIPTTLQEGETARYSSLDGDLYCYKVDPDGIRTNLADLLDIQNANFFKLPVGESQIKISSDTGAMNRTVIDIYRFYRTV